MGQFVPKMKATFGSASVSSVAIEDVFRGFLNELEILLS